MKRLLVAAMASLAMLSFARADETVHKWWESPKVVGLTDMNISSIDGGGCHVGVDPAQTYVGMTVGTKGGASAPLYTWASLESGSATPVNDPCYTSFTNATMHGSAISTVLGVNLVGGLYYDRAEKPRRLGTMYSFPLTSDELVEDENVFVIENDKGWSIDNYFFSPDNQYLYSTTVDKGVGSEEGFSAAKLYKWQIKNDLKASGTNLVLVGEVHDFTNAICYAAFAVINGHEIYYASDARSVRAYDITAGTQTTIIDADEYATLVANVEKGDQNGSAGSLWISGIAEGTPRLTILTSDTSSSAYIDKLAVYQLDGNGTSKISRLALFNYDQMKAFGIGIATGGGASATVKDDDSSLLFSFSYSAKPWVFSVKYCPLYSVTFVNERGTAPAPLSVFEGDKIPAQLDPKAEGYSFAGWFEDLESGDPWVFETDTVSKDTVLYAKWEKKAHSIVLLNTSKDGLGTVTIENESTPVFSGDSVTGLVTNVRAGYRAYAFVDGKQVAIDANGQFTGKVNDSAKIVVTYAKDTAWFVQPFVKNTALMYNPYHPNNEGDVALSANEKNLFVSPDFNNYSGCEGTANGLWLYDVNTLSGYVGAYLGQPVKKQLGSNKGGYCTSVYEGFMSIIPLTSFTVVGVQQGSVGGNGNSVVYPLEGDWGGQSEALTETGAIPGDRYLIDSTYSDVNNGTVGTYGTIGLQWLVSGIESSDGNYVYVGLHARGEITKAAIGTDAAGHLTLKKTGVFWRTTTASGTGSGTQAVALTLYNNGSKDVVYAALASKRLVKLDEDQFSGEEYVNAYAEQKGEPAIVKDRKMIDQADISAYGDPRALKIIGIAEGTPRMVVQMKQGKTLVFALGSDGYFASADPIAVIDGKNDLGLTDNLIGMTALDDETIMFANYEGKNASNGNTGCYLAMVTARPEKVTVRGTFGTYEEGEDTLVSYGAAAEKTFTAPAGTKIVGVKVNGVADANFTADAYTFTDEALTQNAYIEMTVSYVVETPVIVGGKGVVTIDQTGLVAKGGKITGTLSDVAEGYKAFVFVDGVKVAVDPTTGAFEGVANSSAKVVATFAKDSAWYLDPFKRTSIGAVSNGYNPRACELDETVKYLLTGFSPDGACGGPAEWDAAGVAATLNPAFACLQNKTSTITGDSARTLAVSKKYGVVFGPADFADGYPVHPLEEPWTAENGYVVKVDGTNPKGYGGAFGKDGFYSVYGSKVHLHEVQKDAETGVVTNLHAVKEWNVDMKAAWIRVVTINDRDIIYGGTYTSSTEGKFYAIDTADDSVVESPLALTPYSATYPTLAYTYNGFSISGVADGTPHVIIKDYCQIAVYALSSDFKTLASAEPIVILDNVVEDTTDYFENTFMAYGGIACLDDETLAYHICSYSKPQNHVRLSTWVKKPAKLIVRGTFSDEANAEDDVLVDFGGEANVQFAAPAGKKIVGVKVNGVADASFTDAAYTFTDAALTKNVYVEMTVDDLPVAQIGTTTYKTLNAAFVAAQTGDTVELLRDAAVGATIVPTVAVTLDLAGKTLSSAGAETIFDTAVALTVTNGVASLGTAQFINMTDGANVAVNDVRVSGSHDPIFYAAVGGSKTLTIGKGTVVLVAGNSWFDFRDTTLNLYGSVTNAYDSSSGEKAEGAACWPCAGVNVINIYEGASMVSEREDFFRNNRGQVTYNIYGGTFYCSRDAIFYSYYKAKNGTESPVFNIYGGTFESVTFYKTTAAAEFVEPIVTALDDTCLAKFKSNGFGAGYTLADFCASGYAPVKGEDGYYTIQKASVEPTDPEEPIPSEDPEEDAKKMNNADGSVKPEFIKVPEGVTMDGTAKAAYASLFKAVPGDGVVLIELNEDGTNAVETAEQAAGTAALDAVLGTDEASAALTVAEPLAGFFYSLKQSAAIESLGFKVDGDKNKLGGRDTISFTLDKAEASGFYQMIVSPTPVK